MIVASGGIEFSSCLFLSHWTLLANVFEITFFLGQELLWWFFYSLGMDDVFVCLTWSWEFILLCRSW